MNPNQKHLTADAVAEAACFTVVLSWPAAGYRTPRYLTFKQAPNWAARAA